jgi:hypothetical protein
VYGIWSNVKDAHVDLHSIQIPLGRFSVWVVKPASNDTVVVLPEPSVAVMVSTKVFHVLCVFWSFQTRPGGRLGTGVELSGAIVTEHTQPKGQIVVLVGGESEQTGQPTQQKGHRQ